jgi:transcriptional regulator with XRE-family HTH domain
VERGLSLRNVEALTGIAQAQLSHYERGLREPLVGNALILAKFFRSTVEELFSYASI